jgi:hypothetical protein
LDRVARGIDKRIDKQQQDSGQGEGETEHRLCSRPCS